MKFNQRIGLILSGTMAFSAWPSAHAQSATPQKTWPTLPVHEVPAALWPEPPKAPAGAPNVVLILIDDEQASAPPRPSAVPFTRRSSRVSPMPACAITTST